PLYARSSFPDRLPLDEQYVAVKSSLYARLVKSMLSEEEWNPLKKKIEWFTAMDKKKKESEVVV
ncbi:unnamed protein product, partial [marine sediment metagenome]